MALALAATTLRAAPALRAYLWMLPAILVGQLLASAIATSEPWGAWASGVPPVVSFAAGNALKIFPAALLALTFLGSGVTRRDLFLAVGDLRARFRIRARARGLPWGVMIAVGVPVNVLLILANVIAARHPVLPPSDALAFAPVIVIGAAANTFLEEFIFRQGPLARLVPAVGAGHALGITAVRFGIGHWSGNPSGPSGVLIATFIALFAAKCMLDCRGSGWVWFAHWIGDLAIFTVIALTVSSATA